MKALTTPFAAAALIALFLEIGCASPPKEIAARAKKPSQSQAQQTQMFIDETASPVGPGSPKVVRTSAGMPTSAVGQRYQTRDLSQVEYQLPTPPPPEATPGSPVSKGPGRSRMMDNYVPTSGAPSGGRTKVQPRGKAGASAAAVLDET